MKTNMLEMALAYHREGFTIIPVIGKKARGKWQRYQREQPTEGDFKRWFGKRSRKGLAVVLGSASGGLVCRDFDDPEVYKRWASDFPELAQTLPTVETSGDRRHVYCRSSPETLDRTRKALKKRDGNGAIDLGDGELRAWPGCYCVVPPSKHPSGDVYRWAGRPEGFVPALLDIPLINDLFDTGLCTRVTQEVHKLTQRLPKITQANSCNSAWSVWGEARKSRESKPLPDPWPLELHSAIERTLPKKFGQRYRQVFKLCRALQALTVLAEYDPRDLKPIVQKWHKEALPHISTLPFEETWIDFLKSYPNVKYPLGDGTLREAWESAKHEPTPREAGQFEDERIRLLAGLCRELQRRTAGEPFFLSCRSIGELFSINAMAASRWLYLLDKEELLHCESKGCLESMKASEFYYIGSLDCAPSSLESSDKSAA